MSVDSPEKAELESLMIKNDDGTQAEKSKDEKVPVILDEKVENDLSDKEAGIALLEENYEDNSPYAEVRAAVPNTDYDLPANTIRSWVLGLSLSIMGAAVNTLFSLRQPSIYIGTIVAQLISYGLGKLWARFMPNKTHKTFGIEWNINPGPFNVKEHSIVVVMANVSFGTAYATDIILAQVVFYKQNFGLVFQILLTITTQSLGYGIAGLMRKFLVYPAAMIWPGNLVGVSLLHAMHEGDGGKARHKAIFGFKFTKYRWFGVVLLCSYFYYFLPGILVQCLSVFAFITWIAPKNVTINKLFGGFTGISLLPITFDWTQVTGYIGSPLIPPWNAIGNTILGVVLFYVLMTAGLHFGNAWYAQYLPISDSSVYDNTGAPYNVTKVVTSHLTLNETAYKSYSPLLMSTTFALAYGLSFASISSVVVYIIIHHRHEIIKQFRSSHVEKPDIHMRLMLKYKEVPHWWYGTLFVVMLGLSLVTVLAFPTEFVWWAFLLSVGMAMFFTLPIGIVEAVTNRQIGLNVITEFVMGYMQPGKPLALMMFKTYGYITASQALGFVSDLKFGHYMKLPPRTMFVSQVAATVVACVVQIVVLNFSLANIKNVCQLNQAQRFTCPGAKVFYSASVIWGLLGPQRIFSPGQVYSKLLLFFPLGILTPIVFWLLAKRFKFVRHLHAPLILSGGGAIPPATPLNYFAWGFFGFIFQYLIKRRNFKWWSRFNYVTAIGLDTGLALSTLTIFFIFTLNHINGPNWVGNKNFQKTMDFTDTAIAKHVRPGETFGPKIW